MVSQAEIENIRSGLDRIRIFLILYFFSEDFNDSSKPHLKRIFETEMRIQKPDFLLRYPDYLAYELLMLAKESEECDVDEVKVLVREIFSNREPEVNSIEMKRFFFGAYEDIDDVIAFLMAIDFVEFSSRRTIDLSKKIQKKYYLTEKAVSHVAKKLKATNFPELDWYVRRCKLIKKYFGDMSASELKQMQYEIKEYEATSWNEYIASIKDSVKTEFRTQFGEDI